MASTEGLIVLKKALCVINDDPMEILGELPVLRKLNLWRRSLVGEDMTCRAFSFPRLMELQLYGLPNLRKWRVEERAMLSLSEITITKCPYLMMLPDGLRFISTLEKLAVTKLLRLGKWVSVSEDDGGEEGEDFDKIRHVTSIIINSLVATHR